MSGIPPGIEADFPAHGSDSVEQAVSALSLTLVYAGLAVVELVVFAYLCGGEVGHGDISAKGDALFTTVWFDGLEGGGGCNVDVSAHQSRHCDHSQTEFEGR